jgi:hypothetical protein
MSQRKAETERSRDEGDVGKADERKDRIGDPEPALEVKEECPGRRERETGTSGDGRR